MTPPFCFCSRRKAIYAITSCVILLFPVMLLHVVIFGGDTADSGTAARRLRFGTRVREIRRANRRVPETQINSDRSDLQALAQPWLLSSSVESASAAAALQEQFCGAVPSSSSLVEESDDISFQPAPSSVKHRCDGYFSREDGAAMTTQAGSDLPHTSPALTSSPEPWAPAARDPSPKLFPPPRGEDGQRRVRCFGGSMVLSAADATVLAREWTARFAALRRHQPPTKPPLLLSATNEANKNDAGRRTEAPALNPFTVPLHGGVSPGMLLAQVGTMATLLGLDALIADIAKTPQLRLPDHRLVFQSSQAVADGNGTTDQATHVIAGVRPEVVLVELGAGNGAMLYGICPPDARPRMRCLAADVVPSLVAAGNAVPATHVTLTTGTTVRGLPAGAATHVLSHGVVASICEACVCTHVYEALRLLRPGRGVLLLWMIRSAHHRNNNDETFFTHAFDPMVGIRSTSSRGQGPSGANPDVLRGAEAFMDKCRYRHGRDLSPLVDLASVEVLRRTPAPIYGACAAAHPTGPRFIGVRVRRSTLSWAAYEERLAEPAMRSCAMLGRYDLCAARKKVLPAPRLPSSASPPSFSGGHGDDATLLQERLNSTFYMPHAGFVLKSSSTVNQSSSKSASDPLSVGNTGTRKADDYDSARSLRNMFVRRCWEHLRGGKHAVADAARANVPSGNASNQEEGTHVREEVRTIKNAHSSHEMSDHGDHAYVPVELLSNAIRKLVVGPLLTTASTPKRSLSHSSDFLGDVTHLRANEHIQKKGKTVESPHPASALRLPLTAADEGGTGETETQTHLHQRESLIGRMRSQWQLYTAVARVLTGKCAAVDPHTRKRFKYWCNGTAWKENHGSC